MFSSRIIIRAATAGLLWASLAGVSVVAAESVPASPAPAESPTASPAVAGDCRSVAMAPPDGLASSPGPSSSPVAAAVTISPEPCAAAVPMPAGTKAVELTADAGDLWFSPSQLTISSQGTTTITLRDVGMAVHNLTVDELDLLVVAAPGRSSQVSIVDPEPGTYEFYCSVSGHREAGMVGTLIVR